jgi:hypothetical protein
MKTPVIAGRISSRVLLPEATGKPRGMMKDLQSMKPVQKKGSNRV